MFSNKHRVVVGYLMPEVPRCRESKSALRTVDMGLCVHLLALLRTCWPPTVKPLGKGLQTP